MIADIFNDYKEEKECDFKDEHYSVRDNGAILRHPKNPAKPRQNDNVWMFGKPGDKGYLYISGVQVHRIVATAFHGEPQNSNMIVDHIDTNKQNNRLDNLRWITREENVNNPYTLAKLKFLYPEAFTNEKPDWEKIHSLQKKQQDISWMRPVNAFEAKIFKQRMDEKLNCKEDPKGKMGEWMYHQKFSNFEEYNDEPELIDSLTPGAKQVYARWRTPTEFPCVPSGDSEKTLEQYLKNLKGGVVFAKSSYGDSVVDKAAFTKEKDAIIVKTYNASGTDVKSGGRNSKITYKNGYFIHETLGLYFDPNGAEKYYMLAIGEEWTGGDVFDDFC